jgi:hypothetical protein
MTARQRIRPRTWTTERHHTAMTQVPETSRWRWIPLSLVFRRRRSPRAAAAATPPAAAAQQPIILNRLAQHIHYHARENTRIFTQFAGVAVNVIMRTLAVEAGSSPVVVSTNRVEGLIAVHSRREMRLLHSERVARHDRFSTSERVVNVSRLARTVTERTATRETAATFAEPVLRQARANRHQFVQRPPALRLPAITRMQVFAERVVRLQPPVTTIAAPFSRPGATVMEHRLARRSHRAEEPQRPAWSEPSSRHNPVPIVWRKAQSNSDPSLPPAAQFEGATSRPGAAPVSVHAAEPARSITNAAATPALKLDGPALDRLAEDVMKRIDRRMRIERERRGI